jgi:hypothetical protein
VYARHARAFVIAAGNFQRLHQTAEAKLAQPCLIEVQVFNTPPYLFAR